MEIYNDYMLIGKRLEELYIDCEHCWNSASVSCDGCKTKQIIYDYEREQRILATYLENKEESLEKEKNKENSN